MVIALSWYCSSCVRSTGPAHRPSCPEAMENHPALPTAASPARCRQLATLLPLAGGAPSYHNELARHAAVVEPYLYPASSTPLAFCRSYASLPFANSSYSLHSCVLPATATRRVDSKQQSVDREGGERGGRELGIE